MNALHKKLLRDLYRMKGQAGAIAAVIGCGVAVFVMALCVLNSLRGARDDFYTNNRFGDVFAIARRAPKSVARRMQELSGVDQVQPRIVAEAPLDIEDLNEPAVARLVSVSNGGDESLNRLHLQSGRFLESDRRGEALVGEAFAEAHNLRPGAVVWPVINGVRTRLTIVGVVVSPETVFQIREGELLPDAKRFGVFWMNEGELAAALDMGGSFNDVCLSLAPDASEASVIDEVDALLHPYGGLGAYGRRSQLSNRYLQDVIRQLWSMAFITPAIFLAVAAFLLNVVMTRLISTQREQIAALKAFGYTKYEVGSHYLQFVLVIVLVGVAMGVAGGIHLGEFVTGRYTEVYKFPRLDFRPDWRTAIWGFGISTVAGVLGAVRSVVQAMALPAAEGMRPEPPTSYSPTIVERWGLQGLFSQPVKMMLRHLERRPFRSLMSCLGMALAVAILILGNTAKDMVDYVTEFQFQMVQRYDMSLSLAGPKSGRALHEIKSLPGVMQCEPFRAVPVRMQHEHRSRQVSVMGLPAKGELFRLTDADERAVELPPEGLVISEKLAELLDVRAGDTLRVEILEGSRPVKQIKIGSVMADYAGLSAYMEINALRRLMREGDTLSGAFITVDELQLDDVYRRLKNLPQVAGVNVKKLAVDSFRDSTAKNLLLMRFFNMIFAIVIAFGVVYNTARISLAERNRELATMRVVGFTRLEVSVVLLGELAVLTLLAIPIGLCVGTFFGHMAAAAAETETQRFPARIAPTTYSYAAGVVIIAAMVSGLFVRRQLDKLDLVATLKMKD